MKNRKRVAILVIAATNQPVYIHYIHTFWTEIIRYSNAKKTHFDVFLLFENDTDLSEFEHLKSNIIVDRNTDYNGFFDKRNKTLATPGILSKTIYAFEILQEQYDVFFRTNLSSMISTSKLENFVASKDHIQYSGASVWTDALRQDLLSRNHVGEGKSIESLEELDKYVGNTFISGAGYFISAKEVKMLVQQKKDIRYDIIDDVSVGLMMQTHEHLKHFSIILRPKETIEEMLAKLKNNRYCHVRLQHFPPEKAKELWLELKKIKIWL